eukprot:g6118.t1
MTSQEKGDLADGGGGKQEGDSTQRRLLESMGWLTESILIPRKGKAIEGVGAETLVDLKAQLALSQDQAKLQKTAGEFKRGRKRKNEDEEFFKERNKGVLERDKKDRLHLKSQEDQEEDVYSALEKKSELYEKLAQGQEPFGEAPEDSCQVDFLEKQYQHHLGTKDSPLDVDTPEDIGRKERRELVLEQAGLTKKGREKAAQIKDARLQQQKAKREQLKSAFLKKQLAKLKAQKKNTHDDSNSHV